MWFFKSTTKKGTNNNDPEPASASSFEKAGELEEQTPSTEHNSQHASQQSVATPRSTAGTVRPEGDTASHSKIDEKAAPSKLRRPSKVLLEDPFSDAAAASRPCTPIRETSAENVFQLGTPSSRQSSLSHASRRSSLVPPLPHVRRKSSVTNSHHSRIPHPSHQAQDHRRKSSAVDPHSLPLARVPNDLHHDRTPSSDDSHSTYNLGPSDGSQHRRKSSAVDPHSPRKSSKSGKQQLPNFSRHVAFDVDEEKVEDDSITPARAPPSRNIPYFNQDFTLNGERRVSNSLQNQHLLTSADDYHPGQLANKRKSSCVIVNRRASKYNIEEEKEVRAVGKKRLYYTKIGVIITFISLNAGFTAISWLFKKYWWVFAPVILLGNALNTIMVLNLTRIWIQDCITKGFRRLVNKPKAPPPTHIPTTIAMVLACYCESYTDLMRTLDSLSEQEKIEHHKKMFIVICDGQVKGKGMEKSTDRILVEDIFKPDEERYFPIGYESWDGAINGVYASCGVYNDIPYCCIVKKRNLGKRDGLILIRTLLYKYRERHENPISSMGSDFFQWFCEFSEGHGIDKFEWLVGVDADTTFNKECIYELHKDCVADPKLIGSSGLIQVGWQTGNWNLWNIYQNTEYMRAQCLRRMHQSRGTGKVSCLPGACQIIKICEESCGDKILIDLFGHLPDPKDNLILQIRALAGEDRNYICLIFFNSPKVQTTMSMKAIAYTDPPNGSMVFLSQRKRWTLSTCANDIFIVSKKQMNWFERLCSLADILAWGLPIFIMQTFALFVIACIHVEDVAFLVGFASLSIIPIIYGIIVCVWGCHGWRFRLQYLLGLGMVIAGSQFITPAVIAYAIWHMDNFSWGKTREIEDDGDPEKKPAHSD